MRIEDISRFLKRITNIDHKKKYDFMKKVRKIFDCYQKLQRSFNQTWKMYKTNIFDNFRANIHVFNFFLGLLL